MNPRWIAEKAAALGTRWIGIRWGDRIPFYTVAEYPKSGGTWLSRMVSDYLQLPFPQHSRLPVTFPAVIHDLGRHHPALRRVVYLHRDGRDVMTSLYFDRIRIARHIDRPGSARIRRTYEGLLGKGYDPADIVRHLPGFLRFEFDHPGRGSRLHWRDHIDDWILPGREDRITGVSYEGLIGDCAGSLGRVLASLTGEPVDPWRLETTIEKFSMKRQTGRAPGHADPTQHIRKGVVGDWRNHFSREAAETFQQLFGAALVRLGYEADDRWIERYDYPTP